MRRGEDYLTLHTAFAVTADLVEPAHADTVANLELGDLAHERANLRDGSNTFVAESLVGMAVVLVGATDTAVGDLDNDLAGFWVTVTLGFDDGSGRRALENGEIDAHFEI